MSLEVIKNILEKSREGICTEKEIKLLTEWYISFEWTTFDNEITKEEVQLMKDKTWEALQKDIAAESEIVLKGKIVSILPHRWWIAAACIILLFLGTYTFYISSNKNKSNETAEAKKANKDDIISGGNKARLTLGDGTTILLDSASNGNLANQGNMQVIKLDGEISYSKGNAGIHDEVLYNTITTPNGGKYKLLLADGSKIWLNAASSLRFPASFTGKERKVFLTGEGYFEIAENKAMPFKVDVSGKGEVEVLGTHFNITSYSDDELINTTLLVGSIRMLSKKTNTQIRLKPGQQAELNDKGTLSVNHTPDIDAIMAWKDDKFVFQKLKLKEIMRQLERWYDIDVLYNNIVSDDEYVGIISRKVKLSEILRLLQSTGSNRFRIQGKTVIVN